MKIYSLYAKKKVIPSIRSIMDYAMFALANQTNRDVATYSQNVLCAPVEPVFLYRADVMPAHAATVQTVSQLGLDVGPKVTYRTYERPPATRQDGTEDELSNAISTLSIESNLITTHQRLPACALDSVLRTLRALRNDAYVQETLCSLPSFRDFRARVRAML